MILGLTLRGGKSMFCSECGGKLSGNEKFCPKCGALVPKNEGIPEIQSEGEYETGRNKGGKKSYKVRNIIIAVLGLGISSVGGVGIFRFINAEQYDYLALVKNEEGKYGYINEKGKEVIECEYDMANDFSPNGLATVGSLKPGYEDSEEKRYDWTCIDASGEEVLSLDQYVDVDYEFDDNGLLGVAIEKGIDINGDPELLWGFINESGEEVIPCQYTEIWPSSWNDDGLIAVEKDMGNVQINVALNESGKEVFILGEFGYSLLDSCCGLYPAVDPMTMDIEQHYEQWGYVDKNGTVKIPYEYDDAGNFANNGFAPVRKEVVTEEGETDMKWGYIDENGEEVLPFEYEDAGGFADNGLASVEVEGTDDSSRYIYINSKGQRIITCEEDIKYAEKFQGNLAIVSNLESGQDIISIYNGYGLIDISGNEVLPCEYRNIFLHDDGEYGSVYTNIDDDVYNECGLVDQNGEFITERFYDGWTEFGDNNWFVVYSMTKDSDNYLEREYKCTYMDREGNEVLELPDYYTDAGPFIAVERELL